MIFLFFSRINIIIPKYNTILNKIERIGTSDAGSLINLNMLIINRISVTMTRHLFPENFLDSFPIKIIF